MQITNIVGDYTYSQPFSQASKELKKRYKGKVVMRNHFCQRHQIFTPKQIESLEKDVAEADIIFLCTVFDDAVLDILEKYHDSDKVFLVLASVARGMKMARIGKFCVGDIVDSFADSKLKKVFSLLKGLTGKSSPMEVRKVLDRADAMLKLLKFGKWKDAHTYIRAWKYFHTGGRENILNMYLFLLTEYYGFKAQYKLPTETPKSYIVHPRAEDIFTSIDEYLSWYDIPAWMPINGSKQKKRPMVGMLFYNHRYQNEDANDLYAVIEKLETTGIGVIPAISSGLENMNTINKFFMTDNGPRVDAVISFLYFRIEGGPLGGNYEACEELCRQMNIPFMSYVTMRYSTHEEWQERPEGLSPLETNLAMVFPELDGLIEEVLISGNKETSENGHGMVRIMEPLEGRVEHAVSRTAKWLQLKYKENKDKKIAFVLFNYPPGKDTIGNAGNLDTLESLIRLLDRMREEGYTVSGYPRTRHELLRLITGKNVVNQSNWSSITRVKEYAQKVPVHVYKEWFKELPESAQKEIVRAWGDAPGELMTDEENLYIPGLMFGNIFVGFQPARGVHGDPTKSYHDTALPPHHQYLAFYRWLEREYQADALVHFGTHGTMEFLPGKQTGLSGECFPDILIGSLPHLYFYTCSNPSEAMIAKRRSYAILIDHMTPPMIVSDLYGTFAEMESDIHNYYHLVEQSPARAKELMQKILDEAKQNNLVDIEAEKIDISLLYNDLTEMKGSMMTKGVHVMGDALAGDDLVDYVLGIVRFDRGELGSLQRCLAEGYGQTWDALRENPSRILPSGEVAGMLADTINEQARMLLVDLLTKKMTVKKVIKKHVKKKPGKEALKKLNETLEFASQIASKLEVNHEIENIIRALNVQFISPGLSGDPMRSPGVIPTARNPYQFNPDLVPTPLACRRGEIIANQVLDAYQADNQGQYPETVGVVLWGFETMKTQGETLGEIFHLIGVKPKRSETGDVCGVEVIPLEKLGRPRIDVAVEICGIFRDTFPVLLRYLDRAIRMASAMDEPLDKNYIRKHTQAVQAALEKEGIPKDKAEILAAARVFGPSESNYGTDVTDLIESSEWQEQSQIADMHLAKMAHLYGDAYYAESSVSTFREVLDTVDVIAQVRDNDEYGVADLDHYYEFMGGLSCTVEAVRKKNPSKGKKGRVNILVADSTRDKIKTSDIKSTLEYEVRTKLLNPAWMKGQLDSGYRGVKNMGDRMEYLLGWQATSTGSVSNWVWSEMADKYLFNEEVRKQMMHENVWAVEGQLQRLMEAYQRGMWDATDEEIAKLKQIYLELEAEIEEQDS